jgi:hypothetical protein
LEKRTLCTIGPESVSSQDDGVSYGVLGYVIKYGKRGHVRTLH